MPISAGAVLKLIASVAVALGDRMRKIETARSLPYKGVWQPDISDAHGDFVGRPGSMFFADQPSRAASRPMIRRYGGCASRRARTT